MKAVNIESTQEEFKLQPMMTHAGSSIDIFTHSPKLANPAASELLQLKFQQLACHSFGPKPVSLEPGLESTTAVREYLTYSGLSLESCPSVFCGSAQVNLACNTCQKVASNRQTDHTAHNL